MAGMAHARLQDPRRTSVAMPHVRSDRSREATEAAVLQRLRALVGGMGQSARAIEERTGVTNAQLFLLQHLASGEGSSVRDLAAHAHTGQSAVSAIVGRLVARRLVRRARSPVDGRSVVLTLTESGRALVRRAPEPPTTRLLRALADLDARELSALVRGLAGLSRSMRLPEQSSAMLFESPARRRTPRGTVRRAMRRST
jgi:MarR family transcriptional regulator, organic hydroperoxide resistance regulator